MKQKIYVLMISTKFPATHPRAGEPTNFAHKVEAAINKWNDHELKNHTIRANYNYWHGIFEEIYAGRGVLSLRQWTGEPYRSKQVEFMRLTREDGIGLQRLKFDKSGFLPNVDYKPVSIGRLANNDGLSLDDWSDWFKSYDLSKPMEIIHFTNFRY